jgi:oxygen-dependent protoporphyrinogen oxidase
MDVAVIGGGPAGLAAAWRLVRAGARVRVYERREVVGGGLRTDVLDGVRVDPVVQLLGSHYRATMRLAEEVGARGLIVRAPGRDALWRGGRPHPITYGSVGSMIVSGALPLRLKLQLARDYVPFLQRHRAALDLNHPARSAEAGLDRESIAEWGRRELGEEFSELLAYPLLAAYHGAAPEEVAAGFYHALAREGMGVTVYGVAGGVGELSAAVVRALEAAGAAFRTGSGVEALAASEDGVIVRWPGGEARHDAAVVAVPAPVARELVGLPEPAAAWLSGTRSAPTATLALVLDRPVDADYFGLSFTRREPPGDRLAAVCVEERKGVGLVPEGKGVLVCYPAPAVAARLAEAPPAEVLDFLMPAVERAFPGIRSHVVRAKSYRLPEGIAVFYPGYAGHLARFDPGWLGPRLALAGSYLVSPTVEGAVRSGESAAERLLRAA